MHKSIARLGDLQLRILQVLWKWPGASVSAVQQTLDGEPLAYTTVATMLRKMEDRGLVAHDIEGRRFLYRANVTPDDVSQNVVGTLVDRLFEGNVAAAVHHLIQSRDVDPQELERLEALIRDRRRLEQ